MNLNILRKPSSPRFRINCFAARFPREINRVFFCLPLPRDAFTHLFVPFAQHNSVAAVKLKNVFLSCIQERLKFHTRPPPSLRCSPPPIIVRYTKRFASIEITAFTSAYMRIITRCCICGTKRFVMMILYLYGQCVGRSAVFILRI